MIVDVGVCVWLSIGVVVLVDVLYEGGGAGDDESADDEVGVLEDL